jgi:hypothetical protein
MLERLAQFTRRWMIDAAIALLVLGAVAVVFLAQGEWARWVPGVAVLLGAAAFLLILRPRHGDVATLLKRPDPAAAIAYYRAGLRRAEDGVSGSVCYQAGLCRQWRRCGSDVRQRL